MQLGKLTGNPPNCISARKLGYKSSISNDPSSWPNVKSDRALISKCTGRDANELGGFPVNSPDCMPPDQNVNNTWKNLFGGFSDTFQKPKSSRQTTVVLSMTSMLTKLDLVVLECHETVPFGDFAKYAENRYSINEKLFSNIDLSRVSLYRIVI